MGGERVEPFHQKVEQAIADADARVARGRMGVGGGQHLCIDTVLERVDDVVLGGKGDQYIGQRHPSIGGHVGQGEPPPAVPRDPCHGGVDHGVPRIARGRGLRLAFAACLA